MVGVRGSLRPVENPGRQLINMAFLKGGHILAEKTLRKFINSPPLFPPPKGGEAN